MILTEQAEENLGYLRNTLSNQFFRSKDILPLFPTPSFDASTLTPNGPLSEWPVGFSLDLGRGPGGRKIPEAKFGWDERSFLFSLQI